VTERPPLSALLADPGSVVLRTDLLAAGWPERLVDALFQRVGRREPGYARPFVLAADVNGGACSSVKRPESGPLPSPSATIATVPRGVPGSVHIVARGEGPRRRFLVRFRLGGREAALEHAGSFKRKADAVLRRNFVIGLMAAGEGDEIRRRLRSTGAADGAVTVRTAAERWQASRVDVAAGTAQTYRVALSRILPRLAIGRWRRSTSRRSPTWCPSCRG